MHPFYIIVGLGITIVYLTNSKKYISDPSTWHLILKMHNSTYINVCYTKTHLVFGNKQTEIEWYISYYLTDAIMIRKTKDVIWNFAILSFKKSYQVSRVCFIFNRVIWTRTRLLLHETRRIYIVCSSVNCTGGGLNASEIFLHGHNSYCNTRYLQWAYFWDQISWIENL